MRGCNGRLLVSWVGGNTGYAMANWMKGSVCHSTSNEWAGAAIRKFSNWSIIFESEWPIGRSSDGWAKNQLGERRLDELFFRRQTIERQARTVRRQQIGRLGDIVQTVGRNV